MHRFNEPTRTCGVGRFVVDIPAAMTFSGGYSMRTFDLKETVWDMNLAVEQAENLWNETIAEIQKMPPPEGIPSALLETKQIDGIGNGLRFAFSHKNELRPKRAHLDALLIMDTTGLWIAAFGKATGKDFMYRKSTDIARAYRAPEKRFDRAEVIDGRDAFYLRYGAVDLPFEYKESVDIVFREHALDDRLKIHIMTWVVHEENKIGLLERAANSLMMKLVGDLKIEKLRSGRRTVAGLPGEELIERFTENGRSTLSFAWMHLGKKDSAHWPRVVVEMESRDGRLEEKLALWDALLDSMRTTGTQRR